MKKSGVIGIAAAAVALIGGGTAFALTQDAPEPTETPAAVVSETPEATETPQVDETPDPAVSQTPVAEPTPPGEAVQSPAPSDTALPSEPEYSELESQFLQVIGGWIRESGYVGSDEDILAAAHEACARVEAGEKPLEFRVIEGVTMNVNTGFINASFRDWDIC